MCDDIKGYSFYFTNKVKYLIQLFLTMFIFGENIIGTLKIWIKNVIVIFFNIALYKVIALYYLLPFW